MTALGFSKTIIFLPTQSDASLADGRGSGHWLRGIVEGDLRSQAGSVGAAPDTPLPSHRLPPPPVFSPLDVCSPPSTQPSLLPLAAAGTPWLRLGHPGCPSQPCRLSRVSRSRRPSALRRSFEMAFVWFLPPGLLHHHRPASPGRFKTIDWTYAFQKPHKGWQPSPQRDSSLLCVVLDPSPRK